MMADSDEFLIPAPKKTVRFGGTVANVLLKYKQGDTADYELLKHQLTDPDIKDAQILSWLQEFRGSVMLLTKDFEQLITIVLKLRWLNRSKEIVEEYLAFLGNLVSAQTVYLRACLSMIASNFIPPRILIQDGNVNISDSEDEDSLPANFSACHRALQIIARYVPSTPRFLVPILAEKFPFINKSPRTLECYVHNLLRITVYFPTLRLEILELIVERLLKIDVSASRQEIEETEETAQRDDSKTNSETEEGLFNMDEDEETCGSKNGAPSSLTMSHPVAERLDVLMSILFLYIKDVCYVNGELNIDKTKDLYRDLLMVFDKLILPTHACCHIQYFMFYICSFKLGFAESFLEHLWKKLQNPNNPAVIRQTAASYIGSFLARAKFIPVVTVKACLDLLVNWLHTYIANQDAGNKAFCDVVLHGPFYSACQAVFYTFIFRHKQILEGNLRKGLTYLQNLNFERIVMCQLNPLKICLPLVVNLFAGITRKYQLVFCYTIIERNNRQLIPVVRSSSGGDSVQMCVNPLDSFFPFDPCILKRSKMVIDPLYQIWDESCTEDLQDFQNPIGKERSTEEEDDFLKGETPQNDGVVGMTPSSYDAQFQSPTSSVGSPPVTYLHRPL